MGFEISALERLQCLPDGPVEGSTAGRNQLPVGHLPEPLVHEVEPVADLAQDLPPDQLLQGIRGFALAKPGGSLDQIKVEVPPGHGGDGHDLANPVAEPRQAPGDKIPDPAGQGEPHARLGRLVRQRPHRLDDHERVPPAQLPHLVGQVVEGRGRRIRLGGRPDQHAGLELGQGREADASPRPLSLHVLQHPARNGPFGQLVVPHGDRQKDARSLQAASEVEKQAGTHLVGPVEVFQHQQERPP